MLTIEQTIGALAVLGLSTALVSFFLIYPPFGWKPAVAFFCCVYIPALILALW